MQCCGSSSETVIDSSADDGGDIVADYSYSSWDDTYEGDATASRKE